MQSEKISDLIDDIDDWLGWIVHEAYDPYDADVTLKEAKGIRINLNKALRKAIQLEKEVVKQRKKQGVLREGEEQDGNL